MRVKGKQGEKEPKVMFFIQLAAILAEKQNKTETKIESLGGKKPQKLRMRLGPLFAKLKSLDNVYDEMTVKIFQQDSDVIRVCPQEDFWVAVGAMGRSE